VTSSGVKVSLVVTCGAMTGFSLKSGVAANETAGKRAKTVVSARVAVTARKLSIDIFRFIYLEYSKSLLFV